MKSVEEVQIIEDVSPRATSVSVVERRRSASLNVLQEGGSENIRGPGSKYFLQDGPNLLEGIDDHDYIVACCLKTVRTKKNSSEVEREEEKNNWLATQTVEFVNVLFILYSDVVRNNKEWTTGCRTGNEFGYPANVKFLFKQKNAPSVVLPANEYVDKMFLSIEDTIDNESNFPKSDDTPFPSDFLKLLNGIYKKMFRIYAIIRSNECLMKKTDEARFEFNFKTFMYFGLFWRIFDLKNDFKGLRNLSKPILDSYKEDRRGHTRIQSNTGSMVEKRLNINI